MSDTKTSDLATTAAQRPPLYRDAVVVKWVIQVATLLAVIAALWFLVSEAAAGLRANSINTGFDFITVNPNFQVTGAIDSHPDTGGGRCGSER